MSLKDAVAFLNRLTDDDLLARNVEKADWRQTLELAKNLGFDFTNEELASIVGQIKGDRDELSNSILEMVVGGLNIHNADAWQEIKFYRLGEIYDRLIGND